LVIAILKKIGRMSINVKTSQPIFTEHEIGKEIIDSPKKDEAKKRVRTDILQLEEKVQQNYSELE